MSIETYPPSEVTLSDLADLYGASPFAAVFEESWSGTNGSPWAAAWTGFGATVDLLDGAGRTVTAATAYATAGGTTAGLADLDLAVRWKWTAAGSERYVCFSLRSDADRTLEVNTVELLVSGTNSVVRKFNATTPTSLSTVAGSHAVDTWYRTRLRAVGMEIKARTWVDGDDEPDTWDHTVYDGSVTQAGVIAVRALTGGSGSAQTTLFDDLTLTAATVEEEPTFTGHGLVSLGDSITALNGASAADGAQVTDQHMGLGLIYAGQSPAWRGVFATNSYTLEQIRDTHLSSALTLTPPPAAALLLGGTNNVTTGGFTPAADMAVIEQIRVELRRKGIRLIVATLPPREDNSTYSDNTDRHNRALRDYAARNGLDLVDYHRALTDPADGGFKANAVRTDLLHPSFSGAKLMGVELGATLAKMGFPTSSPPLAEHPNDPTDLLDGTGCFRADSNSDGIANGWSSLGLGGGSASIQTDADGTKWQRVTMPSTGSGNALIQAALPDIVTAGDVVEVCARVKTSGFDSTLQPSNGPSVGGVGAAWCLNLDFDGAASPNGHVNAAYLIHTDADGVLYARGVVGAGASGDATLTIVLFGQPASASVYVQFAGVAVRNLTTLGLA